MDTKVLFVLLPLLSKHDFPSNDEKEKLSVSSLAITWYKEKINSY